MIDILITAGWVIGAMAVGAIALSILAIAIIAPFVGIVVAYENFVSYSGQKRIRRAGKKFEAVITVTLLGFVCLFFGVFCFDESSNTFGWPDTPKWMDFSSDDKKREC